jgi:hypothetical protein
MKKREKLAAAVELGRLGGLKGGKARLEKLSAKRRTEIARYAANVRWANHENTPALQRQIKAGYQEYLKGTTRPVEDFMAELEQELKNENSNQKAGNRTKRKRR